MLINRSLRTTNNPIVPGHAPSPSVPRRCPQALAIRQGQNNAALGECIGALRPEGTQSFLTSRYGNRFFDLIPNNSRSCCKAPFLPDKLHFCKGLPHSRGAPRVGSVRTLRVFNARLCDLLKSFS